VVQRGSSGDAPPALVTYKGPRQRGKALKVRPEIQTRVENPSTLAEVFEALGYRPTIIVRKRRRSYRLGRCQVELDQLRRLGRFVEVEGPDEKTVSALCRRLGLTGPFITASYAAMVAQLRSGNLVHRAGGRRCRLDRRRM
jgi:predicted adenylyl cyclase CyaB